MNENEECNIDVLLDLHNKYIDDKFQYLFYEVLCKTEATVAEDWPRYPRAYSKKCQECWQKSRHFLGPSVARVHTYITIKCDRSRARSKAALVNFSTQSVTKQGKCRNVSFQCAKVQLAHRA